VEKLREKKLPSGVAGKVARPRNLTDAYFAGEKVRAAVYQRGELPAQSRLRAPAIVIEYSSTTLIPKGSSARVDGYGNLVIQV
jgi:N-methylhydantoinase A